MAYGDDQALFVDPREPRPPSPSPAPDTLEVLPNADPTGVTVCRTCNRAVRATDVNGDGVCSICAGGGVADAPPGPNPNVGNPDTTGTPITPDRPMEGDRGGKQESRGTVDGVDVVPEGGTGDGSKG